MAKLHPIHQSMDRKRKSPLKMGRLTLAPEAKESITNVALSIFADMSNNGHSFQDSLLAIYLSGLQHGIAAVNETVE